MPNTTWFLQERYQNLLSVYCGKITIRLSSENMIDSLFYDRLKSNDILPIENQWDMLLVETTTFNMDFEATLKEIKRKGYYPLLAHPERYNYIHSIGEYKRLKELGVRFQLNLLSLTGFYGKTVMEKSQEILKADLYDVFGTDIYRP